MGAEDPSVTGGYRSAAEHRNTGAPAARRAPAVAPWPVSPYPSCLCGISVCGGGSGERPAAALARCHSVVLARPRHSPGGRRSPSVVGAANPLPWRRRPLPERRAMKEAVCH
ncbi:unnamed protein product [Boreogadus saida]